jgi:hypothetical protein
MKKQKRQTMQHQNLLAAAAVATIVGGGIFWYITASEKDVELVDQTTTGQTQLLQSNNSNSGEAQVPAGDTSQLRGKNILNIGPQSPGNSLIVDLVNLVKPGYVVVHQADSKGQAGRLIAYSPLLKAGSSEDLVVRAALRASTTYVVSLRNDDGDGKFNADKDLILNNVSGKPVVQNITTSAK